MIHSTHVIQSSNGVRSCRSQTHQSNERNSSVVLTYARTARVEFQLPTTRICWRTEFESRRVSGSPVPQLCECCVLTFSIDAATIVLSFCLFADSMSGWREVETAQPKTLTFHSFWSRYAVLHSVPVLVDPSTTRLMLMPLNACQKYF